jgi:hypothetical protein
VTTTTKLPATAVQKVQLHALGEELKLKLITWAEYTERAKEIMSR